jgi:linoleoyl-CoA desaturase
LSTPGTVDPRLELFVTDLKSDINDYIGRNGRYSGIVFWVKAVGLLLTWVFLYVYIVFYSSPGPLVFFLSIAWGLCSLFIIFNIGHDAVHGSLSRSARVNSVMQYSFNLVGGNAYSWRLKHNVAHHLYTNMEGLDFDTDLSPLMRLSPKTPFQKQYRWQHLTFLLIYPLLSLLIVFVADFKIFFQVKKAGHVLSHPVKEWVILIISKLWYIAIVFIIPLLFSPYSFLSILLVFIIFQLLNGIVIACVFMPSHYFPGSAFYSVKPENYNWFEHQVSTTMNLSPDNSFITSILGGLNLNIAHHLYPVFCHTHYPALTRIIRNRALQHGIVLQEHAYPAALVAHVKYLKTLTSANA